MINQNLLLAGDDAYNLTKSLRFRNSASAYLNQTPTTVTDGKKWTWSAWVKRGGLSSNQGIFDGYYNNSNFTSFFFYNDKLYFYSITGGDFVTTAVFRDPSAWYHIVLTYDSTNSTAADRVIIYVNGVRQQGTLTASPSLNAVTYINNTSASQRLGIRSDVPWYFDGYLTEVNFIDGQALTPSSFGETDVLTGVWKPKKYAGTYGTNGFYLPFTDVATTSGSNAGLGKDFSGNGNYWNTNNISVTAGSTYDSMNDVPTMSLLASNYAVMNPLWKLGGSGYIIPTNGNLTVTSPGNNIIASTIPVPSTGKYYMEFKLTSAVYPEFGLCNNVANGGGGANNIFGMYMSLWFANGSYSSHDGNVPDTSGDIGLIAVDADNNKLWIGRNRSGTVVWMGGGNPATGTSPSFSASGGGGVYATTFDAQIFNNPFVASGGGSDVWDANFGQQGFYGTPPTGFVALNTYNLPTSTIVKGNTVMDATLYTGTGSTLAVTNTAGFKPDFIWVKSRTYGSSHGLVDSVRGLASGLNSNATSAQTTLTDSITSINSNGFSLGADSTTWFNYGGSYVAWQWQAGQGTTSSNTAGSITSTVSVNASAGFSVVTFTMPSSGVSTIGHGLGVAPSMIILKSRANSSGWVIYHTSTGAGGYTLLNTTAAYAADSNAFNNTTPTSSVFTVGTSFNGLSGTYLAYCWSEIAGFSKFGSYTGNGSTDGTFVYTGFRPKYIMWKRSSGTGDWLIQDTSRSPYNLSDSILYANYADAEANGGGYGIDILSNGFKFRNSATYANANGSTYIYMAFAENPFKNALAR